MNLRDLFEVSKSTIKTHFKITHHCEKNTDYLLMDNLIRDRLSTPIHENIHTSSGIFSNV